MSIVVPTPALDGVMTPHVRAVLFDVDGTLYWQPALRALMAMEFAAAATLAPVRVSRAARLVRVFRHVREDLRDIARPGEWLADAQFTHAAIRAGVDIAQMTAAVNEWISERPLKHLPYVRRRGLVKLLSTLRAREVRVGALSDYPVDAKLQALGVADAFSLRLCTTDRAINAFKPEPTGFRLACEMWGLSPEEVLYVGDRPEVDGAGAAAAGLPCVIVGRRSAGGDVAGHGGCTFVTAFDQLASGFVSAR